MSQDFFEEILVGHVQRSEFGRLRRGVELESFTDDETGITAKVLDRCNGSHRQIRASYLVGAGGAPSEIRRQLGNAMAAGRPGRRLSNAPPGRSRAVDRRTPAGPVHAAR